MSRKTFKLILSAILVLAIGNYVHSENLVLDQTLYFDFGAISTTSYGETTDGADSNGNYWNNITNQPDVTNKYASAGTKFENLVTSSNATTGYSITLNSRFSTNGKKAGGGLLTPSADNLGDLAIITATQDYFFIEKSEDNSNFTISGLDPQKGYKFYIFASRSATQTRTGTYTMTGVNSFSGQLQLAGSNLGGSGVNQNVSTILESTLVYPDDDGNILFTVSRYTGDYIALNVMKMEAYTGGTRPVKNTYTSVSLVGTAAENGSSTPLHEISSDGTHSNQFELFGKINDGTFKLSCTTTTGETKTLGADFTTDGADFTPSSTGLVYITVDLDNSTINYVPITSIGLTGSIVPGGWSLTDNANLEYQGEGVWKNTVALTKTSTLSDPERFNFVMNKSWSYTIKRISGTTESVALSSQGYTTEDIRLNHGTYTITLDLRNYVYKIESPDGSIDPLRISVMGSSVANGQGATDNQGYAYMYGELLQERYTNNLSTNNFYTSGISVNGNNTINLLARYNELIHEFGKYVIFGVSLGNEGIHGATDQQAVFNQFRDNMQTLIAKAREDGKYPVVMNNYTRGDFDESDYKNVINMNLLIHEWDLPSVNLLGAIDNGAGRWADGYQNGDDIYHPSTDGHREFFYAMVPSLFDAIAEGKSIPERQSNTSYIPGEAISFIPEGTVHPFTITVKVKSNTTGNIFTIATSEEAKGSVTIDATNAISYTSPTGQTINGTFSSTDEWNYITITNYYAQGVTKLYVNSTLIGETSDKIAPTKFTINNDNSKTFEISELFFYRSGMNSSEIDALVSGKMLKSSLEIYAPFNNAEDIFYNYAQSTNKTLYLDIYSGAKTIENPLSELKIYSTHGTLHLIPAQEGTNVKVFGIDGMQVYNEVIDAQLEQWILYCE